MFLVKRKKKTTKIKLKAIMTRTLLVMMAFFLPLLKQ